MLSTYMQLSRQLNKRALEVRTLGDYTHTFVIGDEPLAS